MLEQRGLTRERAQALARDSARLAARVSELEGELPFPQPPTLADVRAALPDADLNTLQLPWPGGGEFGLAFLETLTNTQHLWSEVVKPIVSSNPGMTQFPQAQPVRTPHDLQHRLLTGWAVLLPPGGRPLAFDVQGLQQRSVNEPSTEQQVIGPKEAFVERFDTNIGLIRNRLRDPALRIEYFTVGRRSRTRVALVYVADLTRPEMVDRARAGLKGIAVDFIRTAMDVAELTFQHGWTIFPLVEQTERPDRATSGLVNGRLVLVVEGSPFALLVPVTFFEFQHDGETALPGPGVTLLIRILRFSGLFVALAVPALYVAVLAADPLILPVPLTITLASSRLAIPYPVATETLLMLFVADILAEATAQSGTAIGNALSIVGTLIVGQLMVQAHLASTLLMIVVAGSLMGSFLTLKFPLSYGLRIWKYLLVAMAAVGGLLGWFTGMLVLLIHMANLESAGVPYLAPLSAAKSPGAVARLLVQPGKAAMQRRHAEYRPRQLKSARRRGRR